MHSIRASVARGILTLIAAGSLSACGEGQALVSCVAGTASEHLGAHLQLDAGQIAEINDYAGQNLTPDSIPTTEEYLNGHGDEDLYPVTFGLGRILAPEDTDGRLVSQRQAEAAQAIMTAALECRQEMKASS